MTSANTNNIYDAEILHTAPSSTDWTKQTCCSAKKNNSTKLVPAATEQAPSNWSCVMVSLHRHLVQHAPSAQVWAPVARPRWAALKKNQVRSVNIMLFNPRQRPFSRVYHRARSHIVLWSKPKAAIDDNVLGLLFFLSLRLFVFTVASGGEKRNQKKSSQVCVLCLIVGFGLDRQRCREVVLTMNVRFERRSEGVELLNCPIIILARWSSKIQVRDEGKQKTLPTLWSLF